MRKYNDLVSQAAPLLLNTTVLDLFKLDEIKGSGSYYALTPISL